MIYIFTLLKLVKLCLSKGVGIISNWGRRGVANVFSEGVTSLGGGGGGVEVFRGVGGNFSEEFKQFSMQALIIIS